MSEQRTHRAPSLVLESVSVTYGEQVAISDASLQVAPGELMALVGPLSLIHLLRGRCRSAARSYVAPSRVR